MPNPEFKFKAKPLCVDSCPDKLLELGAQCVEDCPFNYMSVGGNNGTMRCVLCDGPCPQECAGGVFDYNDPGKLSQCTVITTELRISSIPVNVNPSILNDLNDIREIRGSLDISGFNKETFPYLSNLKTVGNDSSQVLSQSYNGSSDSFKYSIIIADTDLVSIDLSSLEAVINGGIRLQNNPSLCYLGNLSYYLANASSSSCVLDNHRSSINECG
ncbi:PREDICTED: epidermal growth factor receptor-like [Amphimedon queenslandica]|uniref:Receptor L-domain domain-containing protein n=1 Tax=Amphimedon queenslandica TaxID=400682 RepID=A0A1X7SF05_AMPQE|nr:PREDICTED: epidermal growth factor receptor-like [Amphimedon queenslandica]|eukprot:XP_019864099.1 PREDICTED: epidermal growth factor receptor-like [Amphimedon queenslandica]